MTIVVPMRIRLIVWAAICSTLFAACSDPVLLIPEADDPPLSPSVSATLPSVVTPEVKVDNASSPSATPALTPTAQPYPYTSRSLLGLSVEGRPIWAWQFGDGPWRIVLVGGIHGGYEANSTLLAKQIIGHLLANPTQVLPGIQLVIIPTANPDGLARGEGLEGRFNANGVDLNRNWGCSWSAEAYLRDIPVHAGPYPFSEPETQALRDYFLTQPPDAVIFYHSSLGAVFTGECGDEHPPAQWLGEQIAEATGYPYEHFTYYDVTGDATNWLAEQGIAALVVELSTRTDTEFQRNWQGIMALQCRLTLGEPQETPNDPAVLEHCIASLSDNP